MVLFAEMEEASKEDYDTLFNTIYTALEDVKTAGAYDQLTLYNGTFMLLYDQRANMVSVNVVQDDILSLLDTVYNSADSLTVQKEQSTKLKNEILDNYAAYRDAIIRMFTNAGERG